MKKNTVGLYDPYLDTLGGGERHILSILQTLEEFGATINLFWDTDLQEPLKNRLNLSFRNKPTFISGLFGKTVPGIKKLARLKDLDIFFYVPDGSYFFSLAKKNFVFCMVPDKKLYPHTILNKLKTWNYRFIANSQFTQKHLALWNIKSDVVYPHLDDVFFTPLSEKKEPIILCVGRFFEHLHSKRQDVAAEAFIKLQSKYPETKNLRLVLAGGLKDEDIPYFKRLEEMSKQNQSITLVPNPPFKELFTLYERASFFWHCAGYGIDEDKDPARVEHFGITPLEAASRGCIAFCVDSGGPKELIQQDKTGFLFSTIDELVDQTHSLMTNASAQKSIRQNARKFIEENFTKSVFKKRVAEVILNQ